jgi:signal transduction histidine kinase
VRTLFAKILAWFVVSAFLVFAGIVLTSALNVNNPSARQAPVSLLLNFLLKEARYAHETGGQEALRGVIQRTESVIQSRAVFTDAQGRDLLTGDLRPELVKEGMIRAERPLSRLDSATFARASSDGQYWLFLIGENNSRLLWYTQPETLWIWALVVLCVWVLAHHLTSPVRHMQRMFERFGEGDLNARADTKRKDELGQLAGSFNRMADRIETLLKAERRLLLDISHELRSPLARLGVAVELARSGDAKSLDRIQREADRLNQLVGELLLVTKSEGDPSQRITEPVSINELLAVLVEDCGIEARARGSGLSLEARGSMVVEGDPELLRRALENVIRNAIRYAPADTDVEIRAERYASRALIRVRDFGPGVPPESLSRLFDPFYRVDADRNRSSGGVGLGLSIARRAVELHGGTVIARNMQPGLEVVFDLPATAAEPELTAESDLANQKP